MAAQRRQGDRVALPIEDPGPRLLPQAGAGRFQDLQSLGSSMTNRKRPRHAT
jgi:hypothetical protein